MATTADIKIGMCIELDGKTFQIVDFQHVKPGKGPAFVRTKLKNLENGRVLENTFSAGAKIEPVRVERRPYQFTYEDDLGAHFMHTETFEEINIDKNLIDQLRPDGRRSDRRGDVPHREGDRSFRRAAPDRRYGSDLYRTGHQRRYRLDQLAQTRNGEYGCDDQAFPCSSIPATRSASIRVPANITSASNKDFRSNRASSARVERTNITPSHIDCGGVFCRLPFGAVLPPAEDCSARQLRRSTRLRCLRSDFIRYIQNYRKFSGKNTRNPGRGIIFVKIQFHLI